MHLVAPFWHHLGDGTPSCDDRRGLAEGKCPAGRGVNWARGLYGEARGHGRAAVGRMLHADFGGGVRRVPAVAGGFGTVTSCRELPVQNA